MGAGFRLNEAHVSSTAMNSTVFLGALDKTQIAPPGDCVRLAKTTANNEPYRKFGTATDEIYAFSNAMLDIIDQILDTETRLDTVKQH